MGTKYIDGDLHVKGKLWQNEEEVNVLFVDGNTGNINNNAVIIASMPGSSRDIISILKPIAGWGLANAKKFVDSLSVGIDLRTHSIDNLQLTDPQIAEFVKQTTEQNLMTFKIPAEEGGTSRLKEITVTKGNKSIIFNNATEIDIPNSIPLLETVINATAATPLTISEIYDLYSAVDTSAKFVKVSYDLLPDDGGGTEMHREEPMILQMNHGLDNTGGQYYSIYAKPLDSENYCFQASYNNTDHTLSEITATTIFSAKNKKKLTQDIDTDFSLTSTNPIQNKVISERLKDISNILTHIKYKLFGATALSEVDYKVDYATIYPIPDTLSDDDGTHRVVYSDTQLKEIEGNSFAFNQLQKIQVSSQTRTSNGVTLTDNRDGTYTVNGTATADANFGIGVISMQAHKYLIKGCPSGGSIQTYYVTDSYTFGFSDVGNGAIYNKSSAGDFTYYIRIKNGTTVNNLVFRPQVFDLTQNGIDFVTAVDEAKAELLKRGINVDEYNEFNAGEIRSTIIKGVRVRNSKLATVSLNKINVVDLGTLTYTKQSSYTASAVGLQGLIKKPSAYNVKAEVLCPKYVTVAEGSIKISDKSIAISTGGVFLINDSTYTDYTEQEIKTAMSGVMLYYECVEPQETIPQAVIDEFVTKTITIPQTKLPRAGSVHDTIKFVEGNIIAGQQRYNMVYVNRINRVDLGTRNWTLYTGLGDTILYWTTISDIKLSSNLLCSSLTQVPAVYNTGDDNSISSHPSQTRVYARTTNAQATASDFKTAMSNVMLNYEKAEPTETTLVTDLTFEEVSAIIEQGGSIETVFEIVPPNLKTAFVVNKVIVS